MFTSGLTNTATRIAGLLVLAIGLAHFLLPTLGYAPADLAAIPEAQREHFVYLGTYSIAFFLLGFAVMTLLADRNDPGRPMTVFLGLMTVVWFARLALELIYPVELPLFFVEEPHPMLIPVLLVISTGYLIGFLGHLGAGRAAIATDSRKAA